LLKQNTLSWETYKQKKFELIILEAENPRSGNFIDLVSGEGLIQESNGESTYGSDNMAK
jgi:hypothetical protein